MEQKLQERKQVVDVLMLNAIVGQNNVDDPHSYKVLVPGAIREENFVKADSQETAIEKVRQVLYVKEQSRLEGQAKLEAQNANQPEPTNVELNPDNIHVTTKGLPPTEVQ